MIRQIDVPSCSSEGAPTGRPGDELGRAERGHRRPPDGPLDTPRIGQGLRVRLPTAKGKHSSVARLSIESPRETLNDLTQPFCLLRGEKKKSKANNDYSVGHMKQAMLEAAGMGDGAVNETL